MNTNTGRANLSKQQQRMIEYLQKNKYVTRATGLSKIGIANTPEIIRQLKRMGYNIGDEFVKKPNRYGEKSRYKRYWLIKES